MGVEEHTGIDVRTIQTRVVNPGSAFAYGSTRTGERGEENLLEEEEESSYKKPNQPVFGHMMQIERMLKQNRVTLSLDPRKNSELKKSLVNAGGQPMQLQNSVANPYY